MNNISSKLMIILTAEHFRLKTAQEIVLVSRKLVSRN